MWCCLFRIVVEFDLCWHESCFDGTVKSFLRHVRVHASSSVCVLPSSSTPTTHFTSLSQSRH